MADDAARPGVEDHSDVGEANRDRDIGDVGDPQPVGSVDDHVFGSIGEDRLVVIAVGRCDIASADSRLQTVLAHKAFNLLVIDDPALLSQSRANPPRAVALKLLTDGRDCFDDCGGVGRRRRGVVVGRTADSHQPASFSDG